MLHGVFGLREGFFALKRATVYPEMILQHVLHPIVSTGEILIRRSAELREAVVRLQVVIDMLPETASAVESRKSSFSDLLPSVGVSGGNHHEAEGTLKRAFECFRRNRRDLELLVRCNRSGVGWL